MLQIYFACSIVQDHFEYPDLTGEEMAWMKTSHQLYRIFVVGLISWTLVSLYFYTSFDVNTALKFKQNKQHFEQLMSSSSNASYIRDPLDEIVLEKQHMMHFYELPKRKMLTQFSEVTSANRDTGNPLAPDFTFHIKYGNSWVQIYEDHGPGCIFRIYLLPHMPTETSKLHAIKSEDLKDAALEFIIDGNTFRYSLQQIAEAEEWPFIYPINTRHDRPASGIGSYTPLCYHTSMTVIYWTNSHLPNNLLEKTIDCSKNDELCPVHIYSAVSRHKFPEGTNVASFSGDMSTERSHRLQLDNVVSLLSKPELNGPDANEPCILHCVSVCPGCEQTLYNSHEPEVIYAVKIRVFDVRTRLPCDNWDDLYLSAVFEDEKIPQIDQVSLGTLFAASGSKNPFNGAVVGRRKKVCAYSDDTSTLPSDILTGYLYLPMPFWRKAMVYVKGHPKMKKPLEVCSQFSALPNHYSERNTGHLHARHTYFTDNVAGWRTILNITESWGHIVGLFVNIDNLRPKLDVQLNARWAALQADVMLFVDDQKAASVMGTGLEDYFSYAHGFALAENTSYSFVGVPHAGPKRKEPLTWHCYRLHVFDPIPFQTSMRFVMEGTDGDFFDQETKPIPFEMYRNRLLHGEESISHLVLYYGGSQPGMEYIDTLQLADPDSEENHQFSILSRTAEETGHKFTSTDVRYVGDILQNIPVKISGRTFSAYESYHFIFKYPFLSYKGVVLRQEIQSLTWSYLAKVWVNNVYAGTLYIPMTNTTSEYSLLQTDLMISSTYVHLAYEIQIRIEPKMASRVVKYQLFGIL